MCMDTRVRNGRWRRRAEYLRATHTGTFQGVPPTGKQVTWTENNIYRVSQGKVVEMWGCGDLLGIMHQIGAIATSAAKVLHL